MDNSPTPYDDVWRTLINDLNKRRLIRPFLIEMFKLFGTMISTKAKITLVANELFLNRQDGEQAKRITDSIFVVEDNGSTKRFHVECQSTIDGSIILRMFEYDAQIALNNARNDWECGNLYVKFPYSGILYLRSSKNTPSDITTTIEVPGGNTVSYKIPILKLSDYSLEDISEKKLYLLISFLPFNLESDVAKIEKGDKEAVLRVINVFSDIESVALKGLENGELNGSDYGAISYMLQKVLEHLTEGCVKFQEEVLDKMGGKVLDYPEKTAYLDGCLTGEKKMFEKYVRRKMKEGLSREEAEADATQFFSDDDDDEIN